jgi:acyl-CoA dehydrogenase
MTVELKLSPELQRYGTELRAWGREEARPLARQADTAHALPDNWDKVLDTCPVPLIHPGHEPDIFSGFSDGLGICGLTYYESLSYGDIWLFDALNGGIGHFVVDAIGTPDQVERWYRPIIEQGGKTGFGMSEPGVGSDTSRIETSAKRDGDMWIINGTKMYCSLGADAEYIVVFATTDKAQGRNAIKAFVVEKGTPGMHIVRRNEDKLGLRCWVTSQIAFDDCIVPAENMLGCSANGDAPDPRSLAAGLSRLNFNRPNVSAIGIGLARASLELATAMLQEQRAGFAPHRWAVIENELEQMNFMLTRSRLLNLRAKWMEDVQVNNRVEASMAKAYAPPTSERIIRRCMQLLGPDGTSTELLLEKWYRDVKILDIFEGTGQIMRVLIGRALMGSG